VHHLWFSDKDYERLGMLIKWNPAIKTEQDKEGLLKACLTTESYTTDHATYFGGKAKPYFQSMSGAPMVQHAQLHVRVYKQELISLENS
jgi:dihydroorotase